MAYDLYKNTRPDEQGFFHVQPMPPTFTVVKFGPYRKTVWSNLTLPDGSPATFVSIWWWKLQRYTGTAKIDGSRTHWLNDGQLGDPTPGYVVTTLPKELSAFRWRSQGPSEPTWDGMGGS